MRVRRTIKRGDCEGCPEIEMGGICSGFKYQTELIRQYEDAATDFLYDTGYVPESMAKKY